MKNRQFIVLVIVFIIFGFLFLIQLTSIADSLHLIQGRLVEIIRAI